MLMKLYMENSHKISYSWNLLPSLNPTTIINWILLHWNSVKDKWFENEISLYLCYKKYLDVQSAYLTWHVDSRSTHSMLYIDTWADVRRCLALPHSHIIDGWPLTPSADLLLRVRRPDVWLLLWLGYCGPSWLRGSIHSWFSCSKFNIGAHMGHLNFIDQFPTQFCTCHNSLAVVACAKFC